MKTKRFHVKSLVKMLLFFAGTVTIALLLSVLFSNLYLILEGISQLFPVDIIIPFPYNLCGLLVFVLGIALNAWANYTLLHVKKIGFYAREPFRTPSTLVVEGPFRFSRNPIYLSVLICLFGIAILFGRLSFFIAFGVCAIALFFTFQKWFIPWEEKKLEEVFGEEYLEYKKCVRRWL